MGRQKLQEIRHHFKVSENTTIFLRAKTECVEYTAVSELGLARLLEYNMSELGLTLVLLRLNLDAATVALCRVRRSELRLEKDRHLYGGGSGADYHNGRAWRARTACWPGSAAGRS